MKRKKVRCPYCGTQASLRPDSVVHGEKARGARLYICDRYPMCDAYVGVHEKTGLPLGTLANRRLRQRRRHAHRLFDTLWTSGLMRKRQAYEWMRAKFGLREDQAHIGHFSEYMCEALIAECGKFLQNNKLAA